MIIRRKKGLLDRSDVSPARLVTLAAVFFTLCAVMAGRLMYLKLQAPEKAVEASTVGVTRKTGRLTMPRGEITDRFGAPLVSNAVTYDLTLNRTTLASGTANETLSTLIDLLADIGLELPDHCPLTRTPPYVLDEGMLSEDSRAMSAFERFCRVNECTAGDMAASGLYEKLIDRCDLDEALVGTDKGRKILALRYDMENADFSVSAPFTLCRDVDTAAYDYLLPRLHALHGVELTTTYKRHYEESGLLCHILGRIGPIYAEEAETYIVERGYPNNAYIGKDGAEKVFEDDLRSFDGEMTYTFDANNDIIDTEVTKEAVAGHDVRLSIDAGMQRVAEDALREQIAYAASHTYDGDRYRGGGDCKAGAAVAVEVDTGELLCCASAPGFDLNTFSADFESLAASDASPLLNRATQGIYPPGSTFKILTAAAALDKGVITEGTYLEDKGEYRKYAPTYTPRCWLYLKSGGTHGYVNVVEAIKVSCNYFFYSISDTMGIETLDDYARQFGLGVKTGIEVPESDGILASPEYREANGMLWNPGDTLQMGIGQSDNAFTPLQLASYMASVVNGGHRYRTTILHEVTDRATGQVLRKHEPEILSDIQLSDEIVGILKYAMHSVVDEEDGTAASVFSVKPYANDIGGKTGTAQMRGHSDTALFVGFAPYDDPKIAIAVVLEYGAESRYASTVAAKMLDYYYEHYIDNAENEAGEEP